MIGRDAEVAVVIPVEDEVRGSSGEPRRRPRRSRSDAAFVGVLQVSPLFVSACRRDVLRRRWGRQAPEGPPQDLAAVVPAGLRYAPASSAHQAAHY